MSISGNVSPQWLEEQYQLWTSDPNQVSPDWQAFFEGFDLARQTPAADCDLAAKTSAVDSLIYRYRDLGHQGAQAGSRGRKVLRDRTSQAHHILFGPKLAQAGETGG